MESQVKQRAPRGKPRNAQATETTDPRFASFQTDPRYRLPSKKHAKVRLDSRFSRMLNDDNFTRRAKVDRYGRPVQADEGKKDLGRLYRTGSDDEDLEEDGDGPQGELGYLHEESGEDDDVVEEELRKASGNARRSTKPAYDPARDGGFSSSSSESESSGDESDNQLGAADEDIEETEVFGPQDQTAVPMGEVSMRIAVVNLDWDNVRAVDLLAVATSFKPAEGRIEGVAVYASEFGRERMQREEMEGPPSEIFAQRKSTWRRTASADEESVDEDEDFSEDDETSEDVQDDAEDADKIRSLTHQNGEAKDFDSTALRRYQLDRLRYYYAVISCSSNTVAQSLYENMDGREYLSSANFFDMRFIPDEVSFDDDKPRDECIRVPEGYRPNEFVTDALQHSKVRLTWDEDDRERKDIQKRAFGRGGMDVEENDMLAYIASASSDEGSDDDGNGSDLQEEEDDDGGVPVNKIDRFGIPAGDSEQPALIKQQSKKDRAAALRAALGLEGTALSKSSRNAKREEMPVGNLQITFTAGLSNKHNGSVFENEPEETTKEKYVRKERERKARRKAKANGASGEDPDEPATVSTVGAEAAAEPDGFNDPFFEDPEIANQNAARKARKEEKRRNRAERAAAEVEDARQRAELELIMADEDGGAGNAKLRHFDMSEIAKAEKQKRKRQRKGKKSKGDTADPLAEPDDKEKEGFEIDVSDPRFAKVFESHEFAIDPNDPRYKGTEGMKALLEEGRKRRGKKRDRDRDDVIDRAVEDVKHKRAKKVRDRDADEDVAKLLQKVKSRSSKA